MISTADDTVLSVVQMLASKRGDAAIITNISGELAGIITDTDVTRRVVAKNLLASKTCVADVMTPNPSCVSMSDPATDALMAMVEKKSLSLLKNNLLKSLLITQIISKVI